MRHNFLDRYSRLHSPVHRLPAMAKLLITFCLVVSVVSIPFQFKGIFIVIAGALIFLILLSRIPLKFILSRLFILETFTLGIALLTLLQPHGIDAFLTIFTKSTLCLLAVILLSNSTSFSDLLDAFKRLRFPQLIITILALMYRYIFVLVDEMERMVRARESRSFSIKRINRWMVMASLIGQLFIRSTERAERIYAAMSARGWK
jgi:cobalt/nickel transport system permease protein